MQKALDDSVPTSELEAANKQYNELTAKYRDIIQRENSLVARSAVVDNLEVSVNTRALFLISLVTLNLQFHTNKSFFHKADKKALEEREVELKKEMTSLKERNHSLEQMLTELLSKGDEWNLLCLLNLGSKKETMLFVDKK